MSHELQSGGQKLYITITTKPLTVARIERLPAVETKIIIGAVSGQDLLDIVQASRERLGGSDGTD